MTNRDLFPRAPEPELCEDEGCDHYGTPHVCNNLREARPRHQLRVTDVETGEERVLVLSSSAMSRINDIVNAERPLVVGVDLASGPSLMGMSVMVDPNLPPDQFIIQSPVRHGRMEAMERVSREMREYAMNNHVSIITAQEPGPEAAERRRREEETMRRAGRLIQYPSSQTVRMSARNPPESNPPRRNRSFEEILADIRNPEIPLPALPPAFTLDSLAQMDPTYREIPMPDPNVLPEDQAAHAVLEEDHVAAGEQPVRRIGFAQRILRSVRENAPERSRVERRFPDAPILNFGIQGEQAARAFDLLRESVQRAGATIARETERNLLFGSMYGGGLQSLGRALRVRSPDDSIMFLDMEGSFNSDWAGFLKDIEKTEKSKYAWKEGMVVEDIPPPAPRGRAWAAIRVGEAVFFLGTIPCMFDLSKKVDARVSFPMKTPPKIKHHKVEHAIPGTKKALGHVARLADFMKRPKAKRLTVLHSEWGETLAVIFPNRETVEDILGFKKIA